ncbi:NAD(P)H-dependent oxidoreductase [Micromonospora sp. C28SCA-DRY-2]|uniref:NADPH-dependent FMN reductase n=1 Tax=Micromonospora sp. C28SCA-DRY-2 TaxID=3059522 RepID=UPI0026748957|nr:NAD(P)H-dependent oxidoreductase [Micromonospora sp. C28SCA-DRY-2]MDO3700283.1 NAD(P)H-dependent oxidoreductase [Micromonospora sp. C28SCA-DRY-2]
MTNIGIILGSTRPGRVGHQVAEWVAKQGNQHDGIDVEVVDIEDYRLPIFDEPQSPLLGSYAHDHTRKWSKKIAEFDGYVFVTPEYNRSIPSALKNAIDYLYGEWNNKAAGFVSYGSSVGGARAVEHLRLITAGLQLAGVRTQVSLSLATDFAAFTTFTPGDRHNTTLRQLFTEVTAWTDALAPLRQP